MTTPRTIVILDDNATNLDAISVLIRKAGHRPVTVLSPRDLPGALDQLDQIDVIFLDLEFPNYDGFEIIKDLKRQARLSEVPIVAYSVHTSELNEARAAGFHSFVGKPLNVERFGDQLERILNDVPVWEVL
jgi:two-component system cell cycle response regulator DivK